MPRIISRVLLLILLSGWPLFASADHCAVAKIGIIAGTWENTSTKTSLTLQAQDSGGTSCHVAETLRFSLESTNATGAFTGQTGNALTYSISSGTANRNFYYENNDTSVYTLTAKAGYGPSGSWTESFNTTYASTGNTSTSTATTTPATTGDTTSSSSGSSGSSSGSSVSSAHYSSSSLSSRSLESTISLSAGRDRFGSVGSPLEFKVESNIEYRGNSIFKWNFGDGSTGEGEILTHTYEYPGNYIVVLNADVLGRGQAVSRINVKIIEPELAVTLATPERVELRNNSKSEISLYGRVLWANGRAFVFPQDTLIMAGQSISFSSRVTGLQPMSTFETQLMVIGNTEQAKVASKVEEERTKQIVRLQNQVAVLQQQMVSLTKPNLAVEPPSEGKLPRDPASRESQVELEESEPQTALVKDGWAATLKRFFFRTQ